MIVSAHLDTVFPIETDLTLLKKKDRIIGPGIGDNSLGVAALFGLLWLLRERNSILAGRSVAGGKHLGGGIGRSAWDARCG